RRWVLDAPGRVVAFALSGLPEGPLDLGLLHRHDVQRLTEPWDELTRSSQRKNYVAHLKNEICRAIQPPSATTVPRGPEDHLREWVASVARSRRAGDSAVPVEPETAEAS